MGELDYQRLPEWVRVRIEGLSAERGWSIERCLEEIVIEAKGAHKKAGIAPRLI